MSVSQNTSVRGFSWTTWIAANLIGWTLGWALFPSVYITLTPAFGGANQGTIFRMVTGALTWAIVWGIAGVAQWLTLWRRVPRASLWVAAGAVSGLGFGIAAETLFAAQLGTLEGMVGGCVGGALGGFIVWLGVRSVFARAALLIPVYAVALTAGSGTAFVFFEPILRAIHQVGGSPLAWAVSGALGGLINGSITGAGLGWLLRQPRQTFGTAP